MPNYSKIDAALDEAAKYSSRRYAQQVSNARRGNAMARQQPRGAAAGKRGSSGGGNSGGGGGGNPGGFWGAIKTVLDSPVGHVLKQLDVPASYVRSHISDMAQELEQGDASGAIRSSFKLLPGVGGMIQAAQDVAHGKNVDLGKYFNAYENEKNRTDFWKHTGAGEYLQRGLDKHTWDDGTILNNRAMKIGIGLAGDLGTDPLMFLGGGAEGSAAKVAEKIVAAGERFGDDAARVAVEKAIAEGSLREGDDLAREAIEKAARAEHTGPANEVAARVAKKGKAHLSLKEGKYYLPDENFGLGWYVPGTGRGGRKLLGYKGERQFVPLVPKNITDYVTRPLGIPKQALRNSEMVAKLADQFGGRAPEARRLIMSGDASKIKEGLSLKTANNMRGAFEAAGIRLEPDNAFGAIEGSEGGQLGAKARDVFRKHVAKDMTTQELANARNAIERGLDPESLARVKGAKELKDFMHEMWRAAEREGVPIRELENYFPRVVTDEALARLGKSRSGFADGNPSFTKARSIIPGEGESNYTIRDAMNRIAKDHGIESGFYEDDPLRTMEGYIDGMTRVAAKQRGLNYLKSRGVVLDARALKDMERRVGSISKVRSQIADALPKYGTRRMTAEAARQESMRNTVRAAERVAEANGLPFEEAMQRVLGDLDGMGGMPGGGGAPEPGPSGGPGGPEPTPSPAGGVGFTRGNGGRVGPMNITDGMGFDDPFAKFDRPDDYFFERLGGPSGSPRVVGGDGGGGGGAYADRFETPRQAVDRVQAEFKAWAETADTAGKSEQELWREFSAQRPPRDGGPVGGSPEQGMLNRDVRGQQKYLLQGRDAAANGDAVAERLLSKRVVQPWGEKGVRRDVSLKVRDMYEEALIAHLDGNAAGAARWEAEADASFARANQRIDGNLRVTKATNKANAAEAKFHAIDRLGRRLEAGEITPGEFYRQLEEIKNPTAVKAMSDEEALAKMGRNKDAIEGYLDGKPGERSLNPTGGTWRQTQGLSDAEVNRLAMPDPAGQQASLKMGSTTLGNEALLPGEIQNVASEFDNFRLDAATERANAAAGGQQFWDDPEYAQRIVGIKQKVEELGRKKGGMWLEDAMQRGDITRDEVLDALSTMQNLFPEYNATLGKALGGDFVGRKAAIDKDIEAVLSQYPDAANSAVRRTQLLRATPSPRINGSLLDEEQALLRRGVGGMKTYFGQTRDSMESLRSEMTKVLSDPDSYAKKGPAIEDWSKFVNSKDRTPPSVAELDNMINEIEAQRLAKAEADAAAKAQRLGVSPDEVAVDYKPWGRRERNEFMAQMRPKTHQNRQLMALWHDEANGFRVRLHMDAAGGGKERMTPEAVEKINKKIMEALDENPQLAEFFDRQFNPRSKTHVNEMLDFYDELTRQVGRETQAMRDMASPLAERGVKGRSPSVRDMALEHVNSRDLYLQRYGATPQQVRGAERIPGQMSREQFDSQQIATWVENKTKSYVNADGSLTNKGRLRLNDQWKKFEAQSPLENATAPYSGLGGEWVQGRRMDVSEPPVMAWGRENAAQFTDPYQMFANEEDALMAAASDDAGQGMVDSMLNNREQSVLERVKAAREAREAKRLANRAAAAESKGLPQGAIDVASKDVTAEAAPLNDLQKRVASAMQDPETARQLIAIKDNPKYQLKSGGLNAAGRKQIEKVVSRSEAAVFAEDEISAGLNEVATDAVDAVPSSDGFSTRIEALRAHDPKAAERAAAVYEDPKFAKDGVLNERGAKRVNNVLSHAENGVLKRAAKAAEAGAADPAGDFEHLARQIELDFSADDPAAVRSVNDATVRHLRNLDKMDEFAALHGLTPEDVASLEDDAISPKEWVEWQQRAIDEAPLYEAEKAVAEAASRSGASFAWNDPATQAERRAALDGNPEAQQWIDKILADPASRTRKGLLTRQARKDLNAVYHEAGGVLKHFPEEAAGGVAEAAAPPVSSLPAEPPVAPGGAVAEPQGVLSPRSVPFEPKPAGGGPGWKDPAEVERRLNMLTKRQQGAMQRILDDPSYKTAKGELSRRGQQALNKKWAQFAAKAPKNAAEDVAAQTSKIVEQQQINAAADAAADAATPAAAGGGGAQPPAPPKPPTGGGGDLGGIPDPNEEAANELLNGVPKPRGEDYVPPDRLSGPEAVGNWEKDVQDQIAGLSEKTRERKIAEAELRNNAIETARAATSSARRIRNSLNNPDGLLEIIDSDIARIQAGLLPDGTPMAGMRIGKVDQKVVDSLQSARNIIAERDGLIAQAQGVYDERVQAAMHHIIEAKTAEALHSMATKGDAFFERELLKARAGMNEDLAQMIKEGAWRELASNPNMAAPREVADALDRVSRVTTGDGMKKFWDYYDRSIAWLKKWQVATPGFHVRNFMSGIFNNYLADVEIGATSKFRSAYKSWQAGTMGAEDSARMASLLEYLGGGQYGATELGRGTGYSLKPWSSKFAPIQGSAKMGEGVEFYLRGALGWDRMSKGYTVEQAIDDITTFHFDYANLSDTERKFKRLVPFYTWSRYNVPLQMEMMLRNPGKYSRYYSMKQDIEAMSPPQGVVPEYFTNDLFGIRTPFSVGGGRNYITPDLPFTQTLAQSLPDTKNFDPGRAASYSSLFDNYLSQLTPVIKTPVELQWNRQLYKGIPLPRDRKGQKAPLGFGNSVGGAAGKFWGGQNKAAYITEQLVPPYARLRRLFPSEEKYKSRELTSWLSFFGMPVKTNTPYEQENERRRRSYAGKSSRTR